MEKRFVEIKYTNGAEEYDKRKDQNFWSKPLYFFHKQDVVKMIIWKPSILHTKVYDYHWFTIFISSKTLILVSSDFGQQKYYDKTTSLSITNKGEVVEGCNSRNQVWGSRVRTRADPCDLFPEGMITKQKLSFPLGHTA